MIPRRSILAVLLAVLAFAPIRALADAPLRVVATTGMIADAARHTEVTDRRGRSRIGHVHDQQSISTVGDIISFDEHLTISRSNGGDIISYQLFFAG